MYSCLCLCTVFLQDTTSLSKRLVAVRTLGQIVESTGTVMTPYMEFPQLLSLLLKMLHEGNPRTRREIMKVCVCVHMWGSFGADLS